MDVSRRPGGRKAEQHEDPNGDGLGNPLDFATERPVPYCDAQPNYAVILIEDEQTTVHLHEFLSEVPIDRDQPRYTPMS